MGRDFRGVGGLVFGISVREGCETERGVGRGRDGCERGERGVRKE